LTGGELAFLGLGVVLGVATGATLFAVLRSRPRAPREVRVTVTPNSVPRRRAATLAADPFANAAGEPARGGPADRWQSVNPAILDRTPVLSGSLAAAAGELRTTRTARPVLAAGDHFAAVGSIGGSAGAMAFAAPRYGTIPASLSSIGIQIHRETDWTLAALRQAAGRAADRAMGAQGIGLSVLNGGQGELVATAQRSAGNPPSGGGTPPRAGAAAGGTLGAGGGTVAGGGAPPSAPRSGGGGSSPPGGSGDDPTDPCAGQRRWAEERCTLAYRARQQAEAAHSALGAAQRSYDERQSAADKAAQVADPRTMREAKETAQHSFRRDRAAASGKDGVEAAARDWLTEINRINRAAREATASVTREREAAAAMTRTIERLTLDADAARRAADSAEAACRAARDSVAECQDAATRAQEAAKAAAAATPPAATPAPARPPVPTPAPAMPAAAAAKAPAGPPPAARPAPARAAPVPAGAAPMPASAAAAPTPRTTPRATPATGPKKAERPKPTELAAAFGRTGDAAPAILRLVRGDRATLNRLVAQLAGDDADERRRWQVELADLVDAILGRSIEAAALTFPVEHPFWGGFSRGQNRDITAALASLGFRFDGLGGWADDRVPTQRDLSLAVGYAGLDPMRVRPWPDEAEIGELFRDVAVAADEYLAEAAGGLTLGELVSMLGRRADALTEVWNDWARLRPLLLAGS
jgi:hypothetical protein